jgi:hypothetical protein
MNKRRGKKYRAKVKKKKKKNGCGTKRGKGNGGAEQILVGLFFPIFLWRDSDPSVSSLAGRKNTLVGMKERKK